MSLLHSKKADKRGTKQSDELEDGYVFPALLFREHWTCSSARSLL